MIHRVNILEFTGHFWCLLNILLRFPKTHFKIRKNSLKSIRIKLILARVGVLQKKERVQIGRKGGAAAIPGRRSPAKQMFSGSKKSVKNKDSE